MECFTQRDLLFKTIAGVVDEFLSHIVGPQEFLEIQLIHLYNLDFSARLGQSLIQGDAQLGATDYIREPVILLEEFKQCKHLRIRLDLVQEYERILFVFHPVSGNSAQAKIEVIRSACSFKHTVSLLVFYQVNLDIIGKAFLPFMPNDIRFPNLASPIENKNLV